MKSIFQKSYLILIALYIPAASWGQWENGQTNVFFSIPEVALIDIEPGTNNQVHFALLPSPESGNSSVIEESADVTLWINYSSALPAGQISRSITAEVSQGQVPPGIKLFMEASEISGGKGRHGISTGKTELSNQPKPIISGIGSCVTGDGVNNGHQIFFSIEISDYTELRSTWETNFLILYTLTDN